MNVRWIHEPPGEWHFGVWRTLRGFSLRLGKRALVFSREHVWG